jgi:sulfite reductase (ferredoxin)
MRAAVEERLGYGLPDYTLEPLDAEFTDHVGVHPQREDGLFTVGAPVHVGLMSGDQMLAVAALAEEVGGDVRVTRQQNFVVTGVPGDGVEDAVRRLGELGFPLDANGIRAGSIGCTGEPHCNFSVTETKTRLDVLIERLESEFGAAVASLRLHLDGCPHACAQHWVGDLGFQGTTARDEEGRRRQAYDVFLRGALGPVAAIGRPVFRRVPSEELDEVVVRLVGGWIRDRQPDESIREFFDRASDDELGVLAGREPARKREREEVAA